MPDHHPTPSPALAGVLAAVRETGLSAHPKPGERVSQVVHAVAISVNVNPVDLQAEVEAWADALDARAGVL